MNITATKGRVTYTNRNFSGVGAAQLLKVGEELAAKIPDDWRVVVTAGPYRAADVSYYIKHEEKTVELDFYSVNPGLHYLPELFEEVASKIEVKP